MSISTRCPASMFSQLSHTAPVRVWSGAASQDKVQCVPSRLADAVPRPIYYHGDSICMLLLSTRLPAMERESHSYRILLLTISHGSFQAARPTLNGQSRKEHILFFCAVISDQLHVCTLYPRLLGNNKK